MIDLSKLSGAKFEIGSELLSPIKKKSQPKIKEPSVSVKITNVKTAKGANFDRASMKLNKEALELLNVGADTTVTLLETKLGTDSVFILFDSTTYSSHYVNPDNKFTLSAKGNFNLINKQYVNLYKAVELPLGENWYFKLIETTINFSGKPDKGYILYPISKVEPRERKEFVQSEKAAERSKIISEWLAVNTDTNGNKLSVPMYYEVTKWIAKNNVKGKPEKTVADFFKAFPEKVKAKK